MRDDQKTKAELGSGAGGKKPIKEAEKLHARKATLERVSSELTKHKNADEELDKARAEWEKTFDAISDWIALTDLKGRILRTNRSVEDFKGISSAQIVGQSCCKIVHGSEEHIPGCPLQKMLHTRQHESTEFKVPDANRWLIVTVDPVIDKKGNLIGAVHITRDITERKRAEEALRESEEKYHSIFNTAASLITSIGANGVIVDCNARIKDVLGYERDEVVGQSIAKIIHPDYMERAKTCLNEVLTVGLARHKEYRMVRKDNKVIDVEINATGVKDNQGKYVGGICIIQDITERKRAEEALQKRTEELTIMNEMAIELAVASSTADIYKLVCEKLKGITGALFTGITSYDSQRQELSIEHISTDSKFIITANKILGRKVKELRIPLEPRHIQEMLSEKAKRLEGLNELMFGTIPRAVVNTLKRALKIGDVYGLGLHYGGKIIGTMTVLMPQQKPLLSIEMLQAFANLVATSLKRKKAEEALHENEQKYRTLVESAGESITTINEDGVFLFINRTGAERFGGKPKDYIGKTMWDLFPKKIADRQAAGVRKVIHTGKERNVVALTELQGQLRWYNTTIEPLRDDSGKVIAAMVIARDIHELKQAEEELNKYRAHMARAEQLAAVGTLSASMAHELTQPLTVIRLSIQNSLAELEKRSCPATVVEDLNEGLSEISGLISIIDRFRNFARISSERTISKVDLKAVAERIVKLLDESAWRAKVTLQVEGMDKLPPIYSHEKDLERLFFSLIENSIQAADGKKSRQVIISSVVKDEHIELRFSDNCSGIAPGNLDRIFEPFFTTKPIGRRTGLGLCVLERIVSRLGGKVRVESKLGKGSTFFVTLPIKGNES